MPRGPDSVPSPTRARRDQGITSAPAAATGSAVFLGLLPSAVGFVAWGYGVARHTVTVAIAALYLVPVGALVVAYAWLGEKPANVELGGGLVSILGVVLINLRVKTRREPEPTAQLKLPSQAGPDAVHAAP
jgi:drug/metabolite transporter (DMT)-like permease